MNRKHLKPSLLIWYIHLDMNLQPAWPQHSLINQIFSVSNANNQNIIERIDSVDAG